MKKIFFIVSIISFFTLSCQKEEPNASTTLTSREELASIFGQWEFVGYSSDNQKPNYHVTLEIKQQDDDIIISGKSSVNFYFATLLLKKAPNIIELSVLGSTKIAGTTEANIFEMKYYENLQKISAYSVQESKLVFTLSNSNETMIYNKIK